MDLMACTVHATRTCFLREDRFAQEEPWAAVLQFVDFDCYVSATFNVIKPHRIDLRFLCGLLNSKLIAFWLYYRGKLQGDNFQVDREPIEGIPLVVGDSSMQTKIADAVR